MLRTRAESVTRHGAVEHVDKRLDSLAVGVCKQATKVNCVAKFLIDEIENGTRHMGGSDPEKGGGMEKDDWGGVIT